MSGSLSEEGKKMPEGFVCFAMCVMGLLLRAVVEDALNLLWLKNIWFTVGLGSRKGVTLCEIDVLCLFLKGV